MVVRRAAQVALVGSVALATMHFAKADTPPGQCHVIDLDFLPTDKLQIVAWIEQPDGTFVDTIFITRQTGTYGLGNRPGRFDFNSGPMWPYGRRVTTFPVWSRRTGLSFPEIDYQTGQDNNLSHDSMKSSRELHFCRPLMPDEPGWALADAGTCASTVFTDKGMFSATATTHYPPRADVIHDALGSDSDSVYNYAMLNPFDAVSQATPTGGVTAQISWPIPSTLPNGDYVMWVEVAKEFDFNSTYNATSYPSPTGIPWSEYGEAYRGQPSVLYSAPFTVSTVESVSTTDTYRGYGDPDGLDGNVRAPDSTITSDTQGTGASRFDLMTDGGATFRLRVTSRPEFDSIPPAAPQSMALVATDSASATMTFVAPGDDGLVGKVKGYEIRYRAGSDMTDANFDTAMPASVSVAPGNPGDVQTARVDGLLPLTAYTVGIRAYDDCHNNSPIAIVQFTTADRSVGEVNACFVATAAYGSPLANDVEMLRHFRDALLKKTVLGELAVETYYTFSPPVAGVIGESDLLRASARAALTPLVTWVRGRHL